VGFRAAENLRKNKSFQFIHDVEALSLVVNMAGSPNCGILLDLWDLYVSGGSIDNLRNVPAQQIVAVQVADLPQDKALDQLTDADRFLPGATGRIDVPAILALLKEKGFDGPVSIKASHKAFQSTRRDEVVKEAGAALDRVWREAGLATGGLPAARSAGY